MNPTVQYAEIPAIDAAIAPAAVKAIPRYARGAEIFSADIAKTAAIIIGQVKMAVTAIITGPAVADDFCEDMGDLSVGWRDTIKKLAFSTYIVKFSYLRILSKNLNENAKKVIVSLTKIDYYDYYDLFPYTRMCVCMGVP